VQRSEDRCGKRRFGSFDHSACKTVLNLLEAVYLRFRKIVVERVTVVKFIGTNDCFCCCCIFSFSFKVNKDNVLSTAAATWPVAYL